jgi:hypothetical protein
MEHPRAGLTETDHETYARDGVVRLSGLIPASDIEAMRAAVWRKLDARSDRAARPSKLTARDGEFDAVGSPAVRALLDDLLGQWDEPARWGLPLVAFHTGQAVWDVPHENWHIDLGGLPGEYSLARFFVILEPSRPGGGGTGYVAGSHRLFAAIAEREGRFRSSGEARRKLIANAPWFGELSSTRPGEDRIQRFMHDGAEADGVPVRVCEMLGEPGDVILMHPLMLHAPMPNVLQTPRMMLTQFVYGRP